MATQRKPQVSSPLRAAGKRIQTFGGTAATSVTKYAAGGGQSGAGASRQTGKANGKATGINRALSNPGASKRSAKATSKLKANAAKKAKRGY